MSKTMEHNNTSGIMERRKSSRKEWSIGTDDIGRAVLEWKVDLRTTERQKADPLARTYDFLKRLDVPNLALEDDAQSADGRNPYDTDVSPIKPDRG